MRRLSGSSLANARRDVVILGILLAAVLLLIWNGSLFFQELSFAEEQFGSGMRIAGMALTLNVALILFGWRRYVDLQHESHLRADSDARAQVMATTDAMTGLANRKGFADRTAALTQEALATGQRVAMLSVQ